MILLTALGGGALAGCGGVDASREADAARCEWASESLVGAVAAGLREGVRIRSAKVVRSDDYARVFFVSAAIVGDDVVSGRIIGTWATNEDDGSGAVFSVNSNAVGYSDWTDGRATDAAFTMARDGAQLSADCVP